MMNIKSMSNILAFYFFLLVCTINYNVQGIAYYTDTLNRSLQRNILKVPFFAANFSNFDLLHLNKNNKNIGIEFSGPETNACLESVLKKIRAGKDINIVVLGGSSSLGADLGVTSQSQTFHAAFVSWWEEVVYPVTNSRLHKHTVTIGGINTAYMSHCWRQYVKGLVNIDIVFWEFFINDNFYNEYENDVKHFISSVLNYSTFKPALIFVKFSHVESFGKELACAVPSLTSKKKSDVVKKSVELYGITAIDMHSIICDNVKNGDVSLLKSNYFICHHPSHLAHAQMAYSIINYMRNIFVHLLNSGSSFIRDKNTFSNPIANDEKGSLGNAQCFTALLPSPNFPITTSIFHLPLLWDYGYRTRKQGKWDQSLSIRNDVRGGYVAKMPFSTICFRLGELIRPRTVYLVISHQNTETPFFIIATIKRTDGTILSRTFIDCSATAHPALSVELLIYNEKGSLLLQIDDPVGKCLLNAIVID